VPEDQGLPIARAGSIALTEAPLPVVHEAKTGYMRQIRALSRLASSVQRCKPPELLHGPAPSCAG
jgi:hypothetical protein